MARERKGFIRQRDGRVYACVQFTDERGRRRDIMRRAENRTQAREIIRSVLAEIAEDKWTLSRCLSYDVR